MPILDTTIDKFKFKLILKITQNNVAFFLILTQVLIYLVLFKF